LYRPCVGQADGWIDGDRVQQFRVGLGNFFDVHAAFGGSHQDNALRDAVGDQRHVQFFLDVRAFFDQQAAYFLAFRAGLVRDQLHTQDLLGEFFDLFQRFRNFHAAAFTTATGVDLCFHNPDRAAQGFRSFNCFFNGHARNTARNRHSVFSEDFFALILMDFHAGFPSDADVYKSVDTAKCVMLR
jgi:hypothetical protein